MRLRRTKRKLCKVKIYGIVSTIRGAARVAVSRGVYTVQELSIDRYRFSKDDAPAFELDLIEVSTYIGSQMKVIADQWP